MLCRFYSSLLLLVVVSVGSHAQPTPPVYDALDSMKNRFQVNTHPVVLDAHEKIVPWTKPAAMAYDYFLRQRWNFILTKVPQSPGPAPRSDYPMYYFYCAFRVKDNNLVPDEWMNDVGEKLPNWFESARLYHAYTGDERPLKIVAGMADYILKHGISPSDFAWPDFPYTCANAGDTLFRGFTTAKRFVLHEIQVDHAAEMGLTFYRLYQYNGKKEYRDAAIKIASTLLAKMVKGSATQSPWPYRVVMSTGEITSAYGANWTGAYLLFGELIRAGESRVKEYEKGKKTIREFLLSYPVRTGYWTDGHSDTPVNSNTYKSNLSASNYKLMLFDMPEFDPKWKASVPKLLSWTEQHFVERSIGGEPGHMWGANVVGEQDDFLVKMDYQTARYAAECARWYAVSGDKAYKEKAYRSLNWVTYCSDSTGRAYESPLSKDVSNWWSDCYGEGPRMFYHVFAAIPEWAPPRQDHILYSAGILKEVNYNKGEIAYTAVYETGIEYVKTSYPPGRVTVAGTQLKASTDPNKPGYHVRKLEGGDYAVTINRISAGRVIITTE
ncbi:hypothetical protein WBG78_27575 [Chryseolinea sp. T2]|uniref:hypothetical protein n=1 Tax=Chryseolinea sp. T2 TaxID=3129255 RepID=UPI0030768FDC